MARYILGSGIAGLMAKEIFPTWDLVPYGQSRYYSFENSPSEDYVVYTPETERLFASTGIQIRPIVHRTAFSVGGELLFGPEVDDATRMMYNWKVYGEPGHPMIKAMKLDQFVCSEPASRLYQRLMHRHLPEIKQSLTRNKTPISELLIERAISTIPESALRFEARIEEPEPLSKDIHVTLIASEKLNLEGATTVLVVDESIPFFRVIKQNGNLFVFHSTEPLNEEVFQYYVPDGRVIQQTILKRGLPIPPAMHQDRSFDNQTYVRVGRLAQHDDFMCVASCWNRLMKIRDEVG